MLKIKIKEENIKRFQKKKDYNKELYLEKIKWEAENFNEMKKFKQNLV